MFFNEKFIFFCVYTRKRDENKKLGHQDILL